MAETPLQQPDNLKAPETEIVPTKLVTAENEKGEKSVLESILARTPSKEETHHIDALIENTKFLHFDTAYSTFWTKRNLDPIKEKLNNSLLLDLGGGSGELRKTLENMEINAKHYINVDNFRGYFKSATDQLVINKKTFRIQKVPTERCDAINVDADMLEFLLYTQSESIDNISINGIDEDIVDNHEYLEEVTKQVLRVLKPGGIVFGIQGSPLNIITLKHSKEINTILDSVYGSMIFQKKVKE